MSVTVRQVYPFCCDLGLKYITENIVMIFELSSLPIVLIIKKQNKQTNERKRTIELVMSLKWKESLVQGYRAPLPFLSSLSSHRILFNS